MNFERQGDYLIAKAIPGATLTFAYVGWTVVAVGQCDVTVLPSQSTQAIGTADEFDLVERIDVLLGNTDTLDTA